MSLKTPFPEVWWCDFNSLPSAAEHAGSFVGVADNTPDWNQKHTPARHTPRFFLPHDENKPVFESHYRLLTGVARLCYEASFTPIVVYCWAGQHRSPAVCAVFQSLLFGWDLEQAIARVSEFWPDFQSRHRNGVYASSLIALHKRLTNDAKASA